MRLRGFIKPLWFNFVVRAVNAFENSQLSPVMRRSGRRSFQS